MKLLSRVVWSEGMHLAPHHFQTQSRYFEDAIHFAVSSLWFAPYGLAACEMDHEALKNATVAVLQARGLFPDGLPFYIPGSDPPPEPRSIGAAFSPTRDSHIVYLAISGRRPEGQQLADTSDNHVDSRFIAETRFIADETHGGDERPIRLGRKNFRLMLDVEVAEERDVNTLALARVKRDGSGRFAYDSAFIPPLVAISASESLLTLLGRLCDMLDEKSRALRESTSRSGQPLADAYRRDLMGFWFLHTIHSSLGGLRHQLLAKHGHPEELYTALARLAGALSCFALESHPSELPRYDHDNLTECFDLLDRKIRSWLELMVPVNCVSLKLRPAAPYFWACAVEPRHLERARWILEIRSKAGESSIITKTPQLVKVCSEKFVPELVRRAVPGMALTHLPVPPPAVPASVEGQYFGITRSGPCWDHIVQTKQVGVYVPGDLPDPELELHIVLES
jgi:type VI secretion system protein ImpJ